jgi:hypothetical protein
MATKTSLYSQAVKELATTPDPSFEIPKEIQDSEKDYYVFIGVISKDNANGTQKIHEYGLQFMHEADKQKQDNQIKNKIFGAYFADMYNKIVLLHDPKQKAAIEKEAAENEAAKVAKAAEIEGAKAKKESK